MRVESRTRLGPGRREENWIAALAELYECWSNPLIKQHLSYNLGLSVNCYRIEAHAAFAVAREGREL